MSFTAIAAQNHKRTNNVQLKLEENGAGGCQKSKLTRGELRKQDFSGAKRENRSFPRGGLGYFWLDFLFPFHQGKRKI